MNLDIVRKLLPARKDVQINSPISTLHYKVRKANKGPLKYYVILFGGWRGHQQITQDYKRRGGAHQNITLAYKGEGKVGSTIT